VGILAELKLLFKQNYEKVKQKPQFWIGLAILLATILLFWLPHWQVSQFGINNATENATLENQFRTTLAQILGGAAIGISLYYTWRRVTVAENMLKVSQEGQITDRFTRAVDQLGNEKMEIRLDGIYALERIANESDKDYWPIMEILTAYVRKNSPVGLAKNIDRVSVDIQIILTVVGRRNSKQDETRQLDLSYTCLNGVQLEEAHLERANFSCSQINRANFGKSHLEDANFIESSLNTVFLSEAHLEGTYFSRAHLKNAYFNSLAPLLANTNAAELNALIFASGNFKGAYFNQTKFDEANLEEAHFEGIQVSSATFYKANLKKAHFEGANFKKIINNETSPHIYVAFIGDYPVFKEANLEEANLKGAKNLTIDQLSQVKTLYNAELDPELERPLREKYPYLFEEPME